MRAVQRMLKRLGYCDGEIDGRDGPGTRSAVRSFQRDFGMEPVDGIAGAGTRARLRREVAARGA